MRADGHLAAALRVLDRDPSVWDGAPANDVHAWWSTAATRDRASAVPCWSR